MNTKSLPDVRDQYIGIIGKNKHGKEMVIVGHPQIGERDKRDIFVRFVESGNVVTTRYDSFISGRVLDKERGESLLGEEWRDVVGYEGRYMVSNLGRVKNLPNKTRREEKILTPKVVRRYYSVHLFKQGEHKSARIHRLVAEAFIPNPNNYPQINHKDEDKFNNRADNLEWCDALYNVNYGTGIKRRVDSYKRNNGGAIRPYLYKPVEMITISGEVVGRFPSIKDAAEETGYSRYCISSACKRYETGRRMRIRTCPYKWRYAQ